MEYLTLDLEANAASAILKLQMLIREPSALERRHDYVIAAIDPQSHTTDMGQDRCRWPDLNSYIGGWRALRDLPGMVKGRDTRSQHWRIGKFSEPREGRQLPAPDWQLPGSGSDANRSGTPGNAVNVAGIAAQSLPARDVMITVLLT